MNGTLRRNIFKMIGAAVAATGIGRLQAGAPGVQRDVNDAASAHRLVDEIFASQDHDLRDAAIAGLATVCDLAHARRTRTKLLRQYPNDEFLVRF